MSDHSFKNLRDTTALACGMFTSGFCSFFERARNGLVHKLPNNAVFSDLPGVALAVNDFSAAVMTCSANDDDRSKEMKGFV